MTRCVARFSIDPVSKLLLYRTLFIVMLIAIPLSASDVYVIQGLANGPQKDACDWYQWLGDAVFHNATATAQTVTLIGLSNGPLVTGSDRTLLIPPGRTTSINRSRAWTPNPTTAPFVLHLDVPDGVAVESRFEIGLVSCIPTSSDPRFGKLSLPIYHALQPAGVPKTHLGSDLGVLPTRNNIAIFNAGQDAAMAHVELQQGCDDALLRAVDVMILPNTTQQFGIGTLEPSCPVAQVVGAANDWVTYIVVTVDQPSLSWVSSIADTIDLTVPYAVSTSQ